MVSPPSARGGVLLPSSLSLAISLPFSLSASFLQRGRAREQDGDQKGSALVSSSVRDRVCRAYFYRSSQMSDRDLVRIQLRSILACFDHEREASFHQISRQSFRGPHGFSMNLSADCLRSGRVRCAIAPFIHYRGLKWKRFD